MKYLIIIATLIAATIFSLTANGQCTNCSGETVTATINASGLGTNPISTGNSSLAGGHTSTASGDYSVAFGSMSKATGISSFAFGAMVEANNSNSLVIGRHLKTTASATFILGTGAGPNANQLLVNSTPSSLMVGFNSIYPTLFVGTSNFGNKTGKVAIGNMTAPTAKLHIYSDEHEAAEIRLEPRTTGIRQYAQIYFGTHTIRAGNNENMVFTTPAGRNFAFANGNVGIGNVTAPEAKLHILGGKGEDAAIYVQPHNWLEGDGAGLALGDMSHGISAMKDKGLIFNTSSYYNFNSGYLKIGLEARAGSVLVCADDEGTARWMQIDPPPPSPWTSLETGDIYYNKGKVGIGTINTTPYALAVKGNIITDEVMVKHYDMWPDFVFKPGFVLKTLQEVEHFIDKNHHLPDVPSANEIKENGYAVGEMNALLLQKIEELTLYIIDQEKRLQTQQQQIEQQRLEFDSFMKTIEQK